MRKKVAACAQKRPENTARQMQESAKKASLNWARLIARIYEVDPLTCTDCGKEIKIVAFVVHSAQIRRILSGINWPIDIPEFDPLYEPITGNVCQLVLRTTEGFPEVEVQMHYDTGPDPPHSESYDSPHEDNSCDPPHWED